MYDEKSLFPSFQLRKKRNAWIKLQVFECINTYKSVLIERRVSLVGSYLFCLLRNQKLSRQLPNTLFKLFQNGQERLSNQENHILLKLEIMAWQAALSNEHKDVVMPFFQKVSLNYRNKIYFASAKTRLGVFDKTIPYPRKI